MAAAKLWCCSRSNCVGWKRFRSVPLVRHHEYRGKQGESIRGVPRAAAPQAPRCILVPFTCTCIRVVVYTYVLYVHWYLLLLEQTLGRCSEELVVPLLQLALEQGSLRRRHLFRVRCLATILEKSVPLPN